jgi:hypothetical protein
VLFLLRSTKKTIEKTIHLAAEGTLIGGRGLPKDTTNLALRGGKVVSATSLQAEKLLQSLADEEQTDAEELAEAAENVKLSDDPATRKAQLEQLAQLATSTKRDVRLAAIRVLGKARSFPHALVLIGAVTDAESDVSYAAHVGLRQLSRKLGGISLREGATAAEKQAAATQWRAWYTSVFPGAE